jgi:hypothetical protein
MLSETIKPLKALAPAADRFNTGPATDVFSMANLKKLTFLVYHIGGTTGTATLTVEQCTSAAAAGAAAIPFKYRRMTTGVDDTLGAISDAAAAGIATVAAEDTIIEIEVDADQLDAGFSFVRLQTTELVNDPVVACVIALGHVARFQGVTMPSMLS